MDGPGLLTADFHLRFFPALLARRWRGLLHPAPPAPATFASHVPLELTVMPMACLFLVALGAPAAARGSLPGMLACGAGALGLVLLLVKALASTAHEPLSYEAFSVSVFCFVVLLGATGGLLHGSLREVGLWTGLGSERPPVLPWGLAGAAAGYPLGLLAGLWNQKLGFLAFLPVLAARLGMIGLVVVDLVLLFGLS